MTRVEIMIVSTDADKFFRHAETTLYPKQYKISTVGNEEEAIELFQRGFFEIILVDVSENDSGYKKLSRLLPIQDKEVVVASFNSKPSFEMAASETYKQVREQMKKTAYKFTDISLNDPLNFISLN